MSEASQDERNPATHRDDTGSRLALGEIDVREIVVDPVRRRLRADHRAAADREILTVDQRQKRQIAHDDALEVVEQRSAFAGIDLRLRGFKQLVDFRIAVAAAVRECDAGTTFFDQ